MKWLLVISLLANAVLVYAVLQKKEVVREEVVEKVIVKKAPPTVIEKKVVVEVPAKEAADSPGPAHYGIDEIELEDSVTDVNKLKEDFLVGKLGFTPKDFKALETVKMNYLNRYQEIVKPGDMGPLSLSQRRALLDLEEERDAEYARAVGEKKWREWESYRDGYNKKLFQRSMKEQTGVIVPMEI